MFTSSCLYGVHVFLTYVCVFAQSGVQHILCCVFLYLFVLCFVYPMLPVSLDYPLFIAPSVFSDVYLNVLWIFHPSQTGSTLQFEKHASQKRVVSFTTIPQTLSMITTCTCKVTITCLPACTCKVTITCLPTCTCKVTITCLPVCTCKVTITCLPACTCKVTITCLPVSPARSCWTFGHCDFVTKTYFK